MLQVLLATSLQLLLSDFFPVNKIVLLLVIKHAHLDLLLVPVHLMDLEVLLRWLLDLVIDFLDVRLLELLMLALLEHLLVELRIHPLLVHLS